MEQTGREPDPEKIPLGSEDLPYDAQLALAIYSKLGSRIYGDVGFIGKDYTNLPILISWYEIINTELLLDLLNIIDLYNIEKSQEAIKKEVDKLKKKSKS
jgi:hypothetical protein